MKILIYLNNADLLMNTEHSVSNIKKIHTHIHDNFTNKTSRREESG
jgi:hypothetical protein